MITRSQLDSLSAGHGLVLRGGFHVASEDNVPDMPDGRPVISLVLFGNAGSSIWESFSASPEFTDGLPDPMNRWSERIGNALAEQLGGRALFPFGGPPYHPFIRWAARSESLHSSRIGMLIHPEYGLWHAYRFAIAFPFEAELKDDEMTDAEICLRCESQACLSTCPADAFSTSGYDVDACFSHLDSSPEAGCRTSTCQARLACPEGRKFHYHPDHARFHMDAFYESVKNRQNP